MATHIESVEELPSLVGTELGVTEWTKVTQEQVDRFADATGDHQWIHTDPERAASGPFGGTIAHGFLTLSLTPKVVADVLQIGDMQAALNYGLNKVRFPAPVPVGSNVRAALGIASAQQKPSGIEVVFNVRFESDAATKPVCVAESLVLYR
jgi:acyl dehydratase